MQAVASGLLFLRKAPSYLTWRLITPPLRFRNIGPSMQRQLRPFFASRPPVHGRAERPLDGPSRGASAAAAVRGNPGTSSLGGAGEGKSSGEAWMSRHLVCEARACPALTCTTMFLLVLALHVSTAGYALASRNSVEGFGLPKTSARYVYICGTSSADVQDPSHLT